MVSSAVAVLTMTGPSAAMADPVIVAAGDIACPNRPCDSQRQTARLIGQDRSAGRAYARRQPIR